MKRKRTPLEEPVLADASGDEESGAEEVRETADAQRTAKVSKCVVCGEECAPNSAEGLCWVCRRLKLSAWRDSDTQMPAQE